ncbi:MAG TPA: DUF362 domain-containing protein [Candidatus Deferrimicrobium sp.]|nr:DUF362 domain-containing protein [Candidatus Deferrimicrobium sp.]
MSEIFWIDARSEVDLPAVAQGKVTFFQDELSLVNKLQKLIEKSEMLALIDKDDQVAVKMHWGTETTTRTIRSIYVRKVVELLKTKSKYVFLTESAGLGLGYTRNYGVGRLQLAQIAGYTFETCLAPLVPADGLYGFNHKLVKVDGIQLKEVYVAKAIAEADKVIVLSHVKGHPRGGLGASIKNLGVGCVAKPSKYMLHIYDETPQIDETKCNKCNKCVEICPAGAIDGYSINPDICKDYRCIACVEACREQRAIKLNWCSARDTAIRIADCAKAVVDTVRAENIGYINCILDVSPICDCAPYSDTPFVPDLGILAGFDPVAIDKASLDLINQAPILPGSVLTTSTDNKIGSIYASSFETDPFTIIEAAKKLQLGSLNYSLIKI